MVDRNAFISRHFFTHGYGIIIDPAQLKPLAIKAPNLVEIFFKEIEHHHAETH